MDTHVIGNNLILKYNGKQEKFMLYASNFLGMRSYKTANIEMHRHSHLLLASTFRKPAFTLSFSICSLHSNRGRLFLSHLQPQTPTLV